MLPEPVDIISYHSRYKKGLKQEGGIEYLTGGHRKTINIGEEGDRILDRMTAECWQTGDQILHRRKS
jgi:hypothetical protein